MPRATAIWIPHWFLVGTVLVVGIALAWSERAAEAQDAKKAKEVKKKPAQELAPPVPPEAYLRSDAWKGVPTTALQAGEIDKLLAKETTASKIPLAAPTTDEQFLRRIRLDLTGQLPTPAEIEQFSADKNPNKRAEWIDKLMASDEYARHWARYWRQTMTAAVDAPFGTPHVPVFEDWLFEQIKAHKNWGEIARALLTAEGSLKKGEKNQNGAIFFLGRYNAVDGIIDRTAETSRVFLGIQIQCAQCHNDRRTRIWKQTQFHELAGFFARMQVGGSSGSLIKIIVKKNGEHKMPTKENPKGLTALPRFLDGKAPTDNADDPIRRKALADFMTDKSNYWFSAAFANRMWSELLGQGFYERADDLSPKGEVVFPSVLNRLAASFQGSGYDTKTLIRAIVSTQAYQRQVRLGESINQHLKFAAVYPARLRGDVLWKNLDCALGRMPDSDKLMKPFQIEFDYDPSLKADEVQGSIAQALWLLNNPLVSDRIRVQDLRVAPTPVKGAKTTPAAKAEPTVLKKLLTTYDSDDPAAVRALYLHTLARRPTDREVETCLLFIQQAKKEMGTRNEAFEDIFRALINTAEFQRRR